MENALVRKGLNYEINIWYLYMYQMDGFYYSHATGFGFHATDPIARCYVSNKLTYRKSNQRTET